MNFLTAFHTDVGIKKKTNQDSLLIHQAQTDSGNVLLAVICDGMGGLAKGEVASACMIRAFSDWFRLELPSMISAGLRPEALRSSWEMLVRRVDQKIGDYSYANNVTMGTTCAALLIVGETYYIMNIGDSRIYLISNNIYQLTKDQTYVQREMDAGRMTYEQSLTAPQRNVLLQCVGASPVIEPDFFMGDVKINQCFMLCCDGFRHVVDAREFFNVLGPSTNADPGVMQQNLVYLTELNKQRRETDNITAALIRTY